MRFLSTRGEQRGEAHGSPPLTSGVLRVCRGRGAPSALLLFSVPGPASAAGLLSWARGFPVPLLAFSHVNRYL